MVQDQLTEYISSQIKGGISRDTIKSALVGAGWQTIDVEDTLKKVEGGNVQPATVAQSATMAQKPMGTVAQSMPSGASMAKQPSPFASFSPSDIVSDIKSAPAQPIRMGDMVSSPSRDSSKNFFDKRSVSAGDDQSKLMKMPVGAKEYPPKMNGWKIADIIEAIIIVGFAALSGFLYFQNGALSAKVNGSGAQSTNTVSQIAGLTAQVQAFTTSTMNLTNQVASLTAENADLQTNLSFLAIPQTNASGSSTASSIAMPATATISGMLQSSGKALYAIVTSYGVKIFVKNSSDLNVRAALTPLIGTTIEVTGTYLQGSDRLTVTGVNGSPLAQNTSSTTSIAPVSSTTP